MIGETITTKAGKLVILGEFHHPKNKIYYLKLLCVCGKEFSAAKYNLNLRENKRAIHSCGCYRKKICGKMRLVHGYCASKKNVFDDHISYKYSSNGKTYYVSPIHSLWMKIKYKCFNPKSPYYQYVGGKGISMCDEWLDFNKFLKDVGDKKLNHRFCRKDKNGGFEPDNCEWVPIKNKKKYVQ